MSETRYIVMTEEELDKRIDDWLVIAHNSTLEAAKLEDMNDKKMIDEFVKTIDDVHAIDAINLKRILRGGKVNE